MKVTVSPDGTMVFDVDTVDQIVDLAHRLKADGSRATPRSARTGPKKPKVVEGHKLTGSQAQTWQWLTAHDTAAGLSPEDYAHDTGVTTSAAGVRLLKLVGLGLAHRVARGRYRPGPPPTDPPTHAQHP